MELLFIIGFIIYVIIVERKYPTRHDWKYYAKRNGFRPKNED